MEKQQEENIDSLYKEVNSIIKAIREEEDSIGLKTKQALEDLVCAIVDENNSLESINQGIQVLRSLKSAIFKSKTSNPRSEISSSTSIFGSNRGFPTELICPLSGTRQQIMNDPVTLASGMTYDRRSIEKHLEDEKNHTEEFLDHTKITSNYLLREMILQWFKKDETHEISICPPVPDNIKDENLRYHLLSLLRKISSSYTNVQHEAAETIRLIINDFPSSPEILGEIEDSIPLLLNPLREGKVDDTSSKLQKNLIGIIHSMSINKKNRTLLGESSIVIPILIKFLTRGEIQTRDYALRALFYLSTIRVNRRVICEFGVFKVLSNLLEAESPFNISINNVVFLIYNLCRVEENMEFVVSIEMVRGMMKILKKSDCIKESLTILEMLSKYHIAIEEMAKLGCVSILVGFLKEESITAPCKECCLSILHNMFSHNRSWLNEFNLGNDDSTTIFNLTKMGNEYAYAIIELLAN